MNYAHSVLIVAIAFLGVACNQGEEELDDAEIDIPMRCTIPGDLDLSGETKDVLKKYEK